MVEIDERMRIAVAVAAALALSANGLAALAAATSAGHWFPRTAAYLAGLSLLLAVPAPELVVMFAVQGALVAGVVAWGRRRPEPVADSLQESVGQSSERIDHGPRFSLGTLLLLTAVIGYAAAVGAELPQLNARAWQSLIVIAAGGAAATLGGAWAAQRRGWRRWAALAALVPTGCLLALAIAFGEWLVYSLADGYGTWPPDDSLLTMVGEVRRPSICWLGIVPATIAAAWCAASLWPSAAIASGPARATSPRQGLTWLSRCGLAILAAGLVAPLAWLWVKLAFPPPIPVVVLPQSNGWDDLSALGEQANQTALGGGGIDYSTASLATLRKELAASAAIIDRLRATADKPLTIPVDYTTLALQNIQGWRAEARLLAAGARAALLEDKPADASKRLLELHRIAMKGRTGGILVDGLVGIAIAPIAQHGLHDMRAKIVDPSAVAQALLADLAAAEPYERFVARDAIWSLHANGWHGRLQMALAEASQSTWLSWTKDMGRDVWLREAAHVRLLALELLVVDFERREGRPPASLAEAIGKLPVDEFRDPFDDAGGMLRFQPTNDGVLIYSVGPNRVDDGGEPADDGSGVWNQYEGDLTPASAFEDAPPSPADESDAGEEGDEVSRPPPSEPLPAT